MTIETFSRDIVPIIQAGLALVGLISLFLLWWQIKQTNLWNKLTSKHNFLDVPLSAQLERDLTKSCEKLQIHFDKVLTSEQCKSIRQDVDAYINAKAFLNDAENICAAVRIGSVDIDGAYAVHSARIIRMYDKFIEFIKMVREEYQDDEIYIEFEKTALEWKLRHSESSKKNSDIVIKLNEQLLKQKGTKKKA